MPVIQKPIIILLNNKDRLPRAVRDDAERKHCGLRSPCSGKISLRIEWEIQRLSGEEKPGEFALKKKKKKAKQTAGKCEQKGTWDVRNGERTVVTA